MGAVISLLIMCYYDNVHSVSLRLIMSNRLNYRIQHESRTIQFSSTSVLSTPVRDETPYFKTPICSRNYSFLY